MIALLSRPYWFLSWAHYNCRYSISSVFINFEFKECELLTHMQCRFVTIFSPFVTLGQAIRVRWVKEGELTTSHAHTYINHLSRAQTLLLVTTSSLISARTLSFLWWSQVSDSNSCLATCSVNNNQLWSSTCGLCPGHSRRSTDSLNSLREPSSTTRWCE